MAGERLYSRLSALSQVRLGWIGRYFENRHKQYAERCEKLKYLNIGQAIDFIPAALEGL